MRANRVYFELSQNPSYFNSRPRMRANERTERCEKLLMEFQLPPSHEGEPDASRSIQVNP